MLKRIAKIAIYLVIIVTLLFTFSTSAYASSETDTVGNGLYAITEYHIDMIVNEDNTFDITEQITAFFSVYKHGIYRSLPLRNTIERLDGTSSMNRAKISEVDVDTTFKTYREDGNYVIQIGSADSTVLGEQTYFINYNYDIGKDSCEDYDELYFNLVGTEWDTTISNFSFTIRMPDEFDASKLGFSVGSYGSTGSSEITYSVDGDVITGSCNRVLNQGEALTVRLELPEGYFAKAGNRIEDFLYLLFLLPIIFLPLCYLIWKKFGKDDQVIETVEFYPPEGFNSLEIAQLYKGAADSNDVVSLLIYLANKGYIKVVETEKNSVFSKNNGFKIVKLKDYDGDNTNERIFLAGLFVKKEPTIGLKSLFADPYSTKRTEDEKITEVTSEDLENQFYITLNSILLNINSKVNHDMIFAKTASEKNIFLVMMILASFCAITIPPIWQYSSYGLEILPFAILFPCVGIGVMASFFFGGPKVIRVNGRATISKIVSKAMGLMFIVMFGFIPWALIVLPSLRENTSYLIGHLIGLACIMGMFICLNYLPKRTPYGNRMLGQILGFRKYLETAEKRKLEAMVMENPQYFYDILPYTYVLGVSDKWIEKFETIMIQPPTWYDCRTPFNVHRFGTFMNSTISSASSAMSSSPPSSGGSSGGGSSGGGSGGGGGGSW